MPLIFDLKNIDWIESQDRLQSSRYIERTSLVLHLKTQAAIIQNSPKCAHLEPFILCSDYNPHRVHQNKIEFNLMLVLPSCHSSTLTFIFN